MTSYDVEQILERINKDDFPYVLVGLISLMVVLLLIFVLVINLTADCIWYWYAIPVLCFGFMLIFATAIFDIPLNELATRQDLLRLQDNNVTFCYEDTSINLDDIEQSSSNSNSKHCKHCKYWTKYANFYWDSGSVHVITNDPEIDKMLSSCIEGSATKQSAASGSAVSDSPKQQNKRGGKK